MVSGCRLNFAVVCLSGVLLVAAHDAVRIVTSVTPQMLESSSAAMVVQSVCTRSQHAIDVYYEGGRPPMLDACAKRAADLRMVDLFAALPWLPDFTDRKTEGLWDLVVGRSRTAKHSFSLTVKAHFIFRKVAALWHAFGPERARSAEEVLVVWLDADVWLHEPLLGPFLAFGLRNDVSTIYRARGYDFEAMKQTCGTLAEELRAPLFARSWPDTGVVVLNAQTPAVARDFVDAWAGLFATETAAHLDCLNDICAYDELFRARPLCTTHLVERDCPAGPSARFYEDEATQHAPSSRVVRSVAPLLGREVLLDGQDFGALRQTWQPNENVAEALLPRSLVRQLADQVKKKRKEQQQQQQQHGGPDASSTRLPNRVRASQRLEAWLRRYLGAEEPALLAEWHAKRLEPAPRTTLRDVREGWLAACHEAFRPSSTAAALLLSEYGSYDTRRRPTRYACPRETERTSEFHLFNYLAHLKGGKSDHLNGDDDGDRLTRNATRYLYKLDTGQAREGGARYISALRHGSNPTVLRGKVYHVPGAFGFRSSPSPPPELNSINSEATVLARDSLPESHRSTRHLLDQKVPACVMDLEAKRLQTILHHRADRCLRYTSPGTRAPLDVRMPGTIGIGGELSALLKPFGRAFEDGRVLRDPRLDRPGCAPGETMTSCLGLAPLGEAYDAPGQRGEEVFNCSATSAEGPENNNSNNNCEQRLHRARLNYNNCSHKLTYAPRRAECAALSTAYLKSAHSLSKAWSTADDAYAGVPRAFAHKGAFWWTSQVIDYLIRPDANTRRRLAELKEEWNWPSGHVLGLHVRRGDTCRKGLHSIEDTKGRRCDDLSAYVPAVKAMMARYDVRAIFLATDDSNVANQSKEESEKLFGLLPVDVFTMPLDRSTYMSAYYNKRLKEESFDAVADARAVIDDILLLSDASYFVGKFSSNVARLAFALSNARKGGDCVVPYESLDATWCSDWGRMTGDSIHGPFYC